jgi:hypothetical protein
MGIGKMKLTDAKIRNAKQAMNGVSMRVTA